MASLFAIDIEFRTELSNHLHLVLRTMPRVAKRWTAEEVVRRWLTITKLAKCFADDLPTPDPQHMEKLVRDKKLVAKLRRRLSSISWFMGIVKLLNWTAKQLRSGLRDTIPADLATVLDHFAVQQDHWLDTVEQYESAFGHAVGRADSLADVAARMELQQLKGIAACRSAFS